MRYSFSYIDEIVELRDWTKVNIVLSFPDHFPIKDFLSISKIIIEERDTLLLIFIKKYHNEALLYKNQLFIIALMHESKDISSDILRILKPHVNSIAYDCIITDNHRLLDIIVKKQYISTNSIACIAAKLEKENILISMLEKGANDYTIISNMCTNESMRKWVKLIYSLKNK